jgi:hypothetical protein
MCFVFSLIPATFLVVIGYFVLFSSRKAEGGIRKFGQVLAIWIFIIALFPPIVGAWVTISGQCPMEQMMQE